MKKRIVCLLCIITIFCAMNSNTSLAMSKKHDVQQVVFNIEVNIPLTGNLAFLGLPTKYGFEMAQEDLKENLKEENIVINLIFGDSQGNPKTAVTIHNQNRALKKIHALFSMLSGPTLALKPIAERENILFIASTVDPSICDNSKNLIRPFYSFGAQGKAMLKVIDEKKPNKVGIIYSTDPATYFEVEKIVIPGLIERNISIKGETYRVRNRDFRTQVLSIKRYSPNIILTYGFGSDIPFVVKALKEQMLYDKAMIIGPAGVFDALRFNPATDFADMYYFDPSFLHFEDKNKEYKEFRSKYIKRYSVEQFHLASVYTYDTYVIIADVLKKARSIESTELMKVLTTEKFSGLAGIYEFTENGDCNLPVAFSHILKNGDIQVMRVFNVK